MMLRGIHGGSMEGQNRRPLLLETIERGHKDREEEESERFTPLMASLWQVALPNCPSHYTFR